MKATDQSAVWRKHSAQWRRVGAPLRPSAQDGELMMAAVAPALSSCVSSCVSSRVSATNLAILGVTPEIVQLPWPEGARLHAFDHSAEMIATIWQPHAHIPSCVTQARWQALPVEDRSIRVALGDGSLNVLPRLNDYPDVLNELDRVLEVNGLLCVRCFIRPDDAETLESVAADAGNIGSFHVLKWRIAMALSHPPNYDVAVTDIHAAFENMFPNREELARRTNWPLEVIDTIDAYRGSPTRYNFPTMQAFADVCAPGFEITQATYGTYELAICCPTLVLRSSRQRTESP